mgnify:CR=1 FL=1
MTVIPSCLFYVVRSFPGRGDDIKRLFRENENFHTLCEDYELCAEALKRWNESASKAAPARIREYAELLEDLESEIRKSLETLEENERF